MKEAQIQTKLKDSHTIHGVFELKLCKTKSIRFDAVKEHQIESLLKAHNNGLYHKLSDFPMFAGSKTRFNRKKPFDFIYLKNMPAFVIVCFYVPRKRKTCYYIHINVWIKESKESKKKSIREERIKDICSFVLDL